MLVLACVLRTQVDLESGGNKKALKRTINPAAKKKEKNIS